MSLSTHRGLEGGHFLLSARLLATTGSLVYNVIRSKVIPILGRHYKAHPSKQTLEFEKVKPQQKREDSTQIVHQNGIVGT